MEYLIQGSFLPDTFCDVYSCGNNFCKILICSKYTDYPCTVCPCLGPLMTPAGEDVNLF